MKALFTVLAIIAAYSVIGMHFLATCFAA